MKSRIASSYPILHTEFMTVRILPIDPESATGRKKEVLDLVRAKFGMVPNVNRGLANSPAALEGYLNFGAALQKGNFSAALREKIALAVSQTNGCGYCVAAHTAIGKMVGLDDDAIMKARQIEADDEYENAVLSFAQTLAERRGWATDNDLELARAGGMDDEAITETIANVVLNIFTNYFNHVAHTEVDFPEADPIPE